MLINLLAKFTGLSWVWGKLDGQKTRIAGAAAILTGAGGLLLELLPLIAAKDFALLLKFVQGLPSDQAWLMLVGGLATLGLGHKAEKAAEAAKP